MRGVRESSKLVVVAGAEGPRPKCCCSVLRFGAVALVPSINK